MAGLPGGTVTFLFTDVEGSTARWERRPEAMRLALARHDALVRAAILQHGGYVVKTMGDAFHAAFSRAPEAVTAALAIQRALRAEPWGEAGPLRVRIALHTGAAEERDGDYYGPPLNRAARLLGVGHGGQILLSEVTAALARESLPPGAGLLDLGVHRLKDLAEPERVSQLVVSDLPSNFPPLASLDARPHNLPIHPTPLLGRDREVVAVRDLLARDDVRLVTLTGPGGTGKTRLGLQVAAESIDAYRDGVCFVELAPISDPSLVVPTIAQAAGLQDVGSRPVAEALAGYLREKRLLLVLDNFEQVLPAAHHVADLLRHCPHLSVLVTSRAVLHLRGEHEFPVPPLGLPEPGRRSLAAELASYPALDLFVQRATEARPAFAVTDESVVAVAEICRRLDGLPLAIELAAARVRLLAPQAMLARLERRLPLLTAGARDLPERQRTLRDTIAWSYDLLSEPEQRLFRRLAVFVGGCTLEAAEAVCRSDDDLGPDVLDSVASLVEQSLLRQDDGPGGESRFTMLETIREFGLEQLQASGEEAETRRRHLAYFCRLAEDGQQGMHGHDGAAWTDRLAADHDNLRTALAWSLEDTQPESARTGLVMAGALFQFWLFRDHAREGTHWLEQLLNANQLRYEARTDVEMERVADPARARLGAFGVHPRVIALNACAALARVHEPPEKPAELVRQSLLLARRAGDRLGEAHGLTSSSNALRSQGERGQALELQQAAMAIFRDVGETFGLWRGLHNLGAALNSVGEFDRARVILDECLALSRSMGHPWGIGVILRQLAVGALGQGDLGRAEALLEECIAWWTQMGDPRSLHEAYWSFAYVARMQSDHHAATSRFMESLGRCRDAPDHGRIAQCLEGFAAVAVATDRADVAARMLGAAARLRGASAIFDQHHRRNAEDAALAARNAVGDEDYRACWSEGQAMPTERAIELARQLATEIQAEAQVYATSPCPAAHRPTLRTARVSESDLQSRSGSRSCPAE